ncbi:JAB domain-containing protein [Fictibacillus arsenicus]
MGGSINASIVHPSDVFKSAILNNSAAIILLVTIILLKTQLHLEKISK